MQIKNRVKVLFLWLSSLVLAACAVLPAQEMSDARQAIQAARQIQAAQYAPELMGEAERQLLAAEEAVKSGSYPRARELANLVHSMAVQAYKKARENTN